MERGPKETMALIQSVADHCGINRDDIPPLIACPNMPSPCADCIDPNTGLEALAVNPNIPEFNAFTDAELSSVIAHELGHSVHHDTAKNLESMNPTQMRKIESDADTYAYAHGYAQSMISAFHHVCDMYPAIRTQKDSTHPSFDSRIHAAQKYLTTHKTMGAGV